MSNIEPNNEIRAELARLALLDDDQIDTSDIPENLDFRQAIVAKEFEVDQREYDVRAIANWFISKAWQDDQVVTQMWLNKIVFFLVEQSLVINRLLLTRAKIQAWDHGPVFRELYYNGDKKREVSEYYKKYQVAEKKKVVVEPSFLQDDLDLFEAVWSKFGKLSASQLRNISHESDGAWDFVWNEGGRLKPGMEIPLELILNRSSDRINGRKTNQN